MRRAFPILRNLKEAIESGDFSTHELETIFKTIIEKHGIKAWSPRPASCALP